jgi:hypothetical protein
MHERCHLVALDKPFSQRFSLFIVWLSILNVITPFMMFWSPKLKPYAISLPWSPSSFVFLFLLFPVGHLIIFHIHLPHHELESCLTLGLYQPHLIHILSIEVSTKVSSISQNQIRAFSRQAREPRVKNWLSLALWYSLGDWIDIHIVIGSFFYAAV